MRWVTMSDVYMDKSNVFALDAKQGRVDARVLGRAIRSSSPSATAAARSLAFGFSLPANGRDSATDLPMRVAFPMLLVNTLDWFAGDQRRSLDHLRHRPRERVPLDGVVGATEAEVTWPRRRRSPARRCSTGSPRSTAPKVGYYDLDREAAPTARRIAPIDARRQPRRRRPSPTSRRRPSSTLGGKKLEAPEAFAITRSQKLWIYLHRCSRWA